ncbi:MAG: stage II sporulation protein M [Gammaproteobacteria bacterium]|nr:stage II sporulation protein M [Gammaproteobacteria bacterium]
METPFGKHHWFGNFCCAVAVLLIGLASGMGIADWISSMPTETLTSMGGARPTESSIDRTAWELFAFILRRNMTVFVVLLLGLVSAGTVTIVVLLGNGIAIGQLIGFAKGAGMSNVAVANLLLPHGVLELGALCVAGAVGLQGARIALRLPTLNRACLGSLRLGLVLAYGLASLSVAAGIEAFVTADYAESLRGWS